MLNSEYCQCTGAQITNLLSVGIVGANAPVFLLLLWHYNPGLVWTEKTELHQLPLSFARSRQLRIPR